MPRPGIDKDLIGRQNEAAFGVLQSEYEALRDRLGKRGIDIDTLKRKAAAFAAAIPSWSVGTGGRRQARFPLVGEPRHILDRLDDCAVIHQLTGATPQVALQMPWDKHDDPAELLAYAASRSLSFASVSADTSRDATGQEHSYRFGSLSHIDPAVRRQAIEHNLECVALGKKIGTKTLLIAMADGATLPGESQLRRTFERYLESAKEIYAAIPNDWRVLTQHGLHEPAPYSAVVPDWGSNYLAAAGLGVNAACLADVGRSAPGVNLETVVARLIAQKKLGGLRFFSGAADPYRLFLVLNELADAQLSGAEGLDPAYMIDQSQGAVDPIESLIAAVLEAMRAYVAAHLVDREELSQHRDSNDALMANETLMQAFRTDVQPILAMARHEGGAAIDPIAAYRAAGYRQKIGDTRPRLSRVTAGGL